MRMFLVSMCERNASANGGRVCSWRTISALVTDTTSQTDIAVAEDMRVVWLARQPSPKKWPEWSTATTASLPACDTTERRTVPLSTYITVSAGSPCAKIVAEGGYVARSDFTPDHSTRGGTRRRAVRARFAIQSIVTGHGGRRGH